MTHPTRHDLDTEPSFRLGGLATRLLAAFLFVTLLTAVVGIFGGWGLSKSSTALNTSRNSFTTTRTQLLETESAMKTASLTLSNASTTIGQAVASVNNADQALVDTIDVFGDTVHTLNRSDARMRQLNDIEIPAITLIGGLRAALANTALGARTLLIRPRNETAEATPLMRHNNDPENRRALRATIATDLARAREIRTELETRRQFLSNDKLRVWDDFNTAWTQWEAVHEKLMAQFAKIDDWLDKAISGGFEFDDDYRVAYTLAFEDEHRTRGAVNARLDQLVELINQQTRASAQTVTEDTGSATAAALQTGKSLGKLQENLKGVQAGLTGVTRDMDQARSRVTLATGTMTQTVRDVEVTAGMAQNASIDSDRALIMLWVAAVLGVIVSVVFACWQTRIVTRPLQHFTGLVNRIAKGDIGHDVPDVYGRRADEVSDLARSLQEVIDARRQEVRITGEMAAGDFSGQVTLRSDLDEFGRALSEMMRITHEALHRVNRHVRQVTDGADSISSASQALSSGSIESAAALVEISASVTQIGDQIRRNAENATQANELAVSSRQVAEHGYAAVEGMVASMAEIQAASQQIARIVKLIDDIAFQTNLLALNAAVEAARAGRHGKGFSVVAEEVRNLAGRSAKAARETATLVEDTVRRVENGAAVALRTDAAFKEILANAQKTAKIFGDIATASTEQSKGIDQIGAGIRQIDHTTQQNSIHASNTANAAQTLSRQTGELRKMMERFQLQEESIPGADRPASAGYGSVRPALPPPPFQAFPPSAPKWLNNSSGH